MFGNEDQSAAFIYHPEVLCGCTKKPNLQLDALKKAKMRGMQDSGTAELNQTAIPEGKGKLNKVNIKICFRKNVRAWTRVSRKDDFSRNVGTTLD